MRFSLYLSVFNLPRQSTAEMYLMLASGLQRGWLREKLKNMPKLNGSGKIKKYNYVWKIFIRAFNIVSTSSSVYSDM